MRICFNAYFSAFNLAGNINADISAFMNPAQLRRLFVCCSVLLAVVMMASCASQKRHSAPPISAAAGPVPAAKNKGFMPGIFGTAGIMTYPFSYGGGPITAGNRSGGFAISNSSIDNLLTTGAPIPSSDRPGLGTTAGMMQYSRLERARLLRKSDTPDAVESFHYNDDEGAKTMVEVLRGSTIKRSGLFSAARERLKVGLIRYNDVCPHYEAHGKRIVIGENGSHYEVRLENRTKKRMEVVLSVDGLNVLTGKAANPSQHGFILEPNQTYDVDGFRKDSMSVRSFVFGSVARSQANAKGGASNVGVIGLAVFEEDEAKVRTELLREQQARGGANAFPGTR